MPAIALRSRRDNAVTTKPFPKGDATRLSSRAIIPILLVALGISVSIVPAVATVSAMEIVINLPAFTLYLYDGDELIRSYPIGIGTIVKPSLLGETTIINKVQDPTYYPPDWWLRDLEPIPPGPENPVGTRWLGLGFKGYGIHGTNEPWSIGTAASAGCIRLHNEDVEELTGLVKIGTRVRFIYETMDVWVDPETRKVQMQIYDDVYNQGHNTVNSVLERLQPYGVSHSADQDFLRAVIQEASGEPRAIGYSIPFTVDGAPFRPGAIHYDGQTLLPLKALGDYLGRQVLPAYSPLGGATVDGRVVPHSFFVGSSAYAPVHETMSALGVIPASADDPISVRTVKAVTEDDTVLPFTPFVDNYDLLFPVQDVARVFGYPSRYDDILSAGTIIGSKAYLPMNDIARTFGIRIDWLPWEATASVSMAKVKFHDSAREEVGFYHEGEVWVPIRLIADRFNMALGWNDPTKTAFINRQPVPGIVRGGRTYAAVQAISAVVPQLHYEWDDERFHLELFSSAPDG